MSVLHIGKSAIKIPQEQLYCIYIYDLWCIVEEKGEVEIKEKKLMLTKLISDLMGKTEMVK